MDCARTLPEREQEELKTKKKKRQHEVLYAVPYAAWVYEQEERNPIRADRRLAEGARESGEDSREPEAEPQDGAVGVWRAVAADGLHGLDEEAEAPHRRHVERQRRRREGQRHQQLQHLRPAAPTTGERASSCPRRANQILSWRLGRSVGTVRRGGSLVIAETGPPGRDGR